MLARLARRFPFMHVPSMLMQVREHGGRGIRSEAWAREVVRYFRQQLSDIPFEELFPEHGAKATKAERASAYQWLGDTLASQALPIYRVAFSQYRRALRENPADAFGIVRKVS